MLGNIGKKGGTNEEAVNSIISAIKSSGHDESAPVEGVVSTNGKKG
jgi:hypothetical protein